MSAENPGWQIVEDESDGRFSITIEFGDQRISEWVPAVCFLNDEARKAYEKQLLQRPDCYVSAYRYGSDGNCQIKLGLSLKNPRMADRNDPKITPFDNWRNLHAVPGKLVTITGQTLADQPFKATVSFVPSPSRS